MKYFYIILLTLVPTIIIAEAPPAFLKDATIDVNLKDGNKAHFSANEWKVVPRIDKSNSIPVKVIEKTQKNRLRVMGGVGPQGYHHNQTTSEVNVANRNKVVTGLGYERKLTKLFSVGAQAITNGTFTLDLGLDF